MNVDPAFLIPFIDYTSLNDHDTELHIQRLCERVMRIDQKVAAVCIYPQFVRQAALQLKGSHIAVATVVNFPQGEGTLNQVTSDISAALADGANEIDVVL